MLQLVNQMPELPEVETTMMGIRPYLEGMVIERLIVRDRRLRWPIERRLEQKVLGQKVVRLSRRGKYILIHFERGGLIVHLGMSGSVRVLLDHYSPNRYDHFDLVNQNGQIIRYRDPRRFGCLLYSKDNPEIHKYINGLGIEPLTDGFCGQFLYDSSKRRKVAVKTLIMNSKIVVGVGNIYASEALFDSGIHPLRRCNQIALEHYNRLTSSIKMILQRSIERGGTTLRDFIGTDGHPGYFKQDLLVYGRVGLLCIQCSATIKRIVVGQRGTFYCPVCQR